MTLRYTSLNFVLSLVLTVFSVGCQDSTAPSASLAECTRAADCDAGQSCLQGLCVCEDESCVCDSDLLCGPGRLCDPDEGRCYNPECFNARDCGLGEVCQRGHCLPDPSADRDNDGTPDANDTCPYLPNAQDGDNDSDGQGDACDLDDDNDGAPDSVDNCPLIANPSQADANGDGLGNACDPEVGGVTVVGRVDIGSSVGAEPSVARVFISSRAEPVVLAPDGSFVFEEALHEGGLFTLRVVWPGHEDFFGGWEAPSDAPTFDVGIIKLVPVFTVFEGTARLEGREAHGGIVVRARRDGQTIDTALTDEDGRFRLLVSPANHTLGFTFPGFDSPSLGIVWDSRDQSFVDEDGDSPPVVLLREQVLNGAIVIRVQILPDWLPEAERHARLSLSNDRGEQLADQRATHGQELRFEDLQAGTYLLSADRPGFTAIRRVVRLDESTPEVTIDATIALDGLGEADLDLNGQHLADDDLRDLDLTGANLSGAIIRAADQVSPADLCGLDLSGANLSGTDLVGADLSAVDLISAQLHAADLSGAELSGADLSGADLFTANLSGADLSGDAARCPTYEGPPRGTLLDSTDLSFVLLADALLTSGDGDPGCAGDPDPLAIRIVDVGFTQADLSGAQMRGIRLSGERLSTTIMRGADLTGSCLRGATLLQADLTNALLNEVDMSEANMTGADLTGAALRDVFGQGATMRAIVTGRECDDDVGCWTRMSRSDFEGAVFSGVFFWRTVLSEVRFVGADLEGADFINCLYGTRPEGTPISFEGARLAGARFSRAEIRGGNFNSANLSEANCDNCELNGASFDGTMLIGADFTGSNIRNATFEGARITRAIFDNTEMEGTSFTDANLFRLSLVQAGLNDVDFTGANLKDANLTGARLVGTTMDHANLRGTIFGLVRLEEASFNHAYYVAETVWPDGFEPTSIPNLYRLEPGEDLSGAQFQSANLSELDLSGVNLTGADLSGADVHRTDFSDADFTDANIEALNWRRTVCPDGTISNDNGGTCEGHL